VRADPTRPNGASTDIAGIDPVTFQVLNNALAGIVDEMAAVVQKCAFSLVVSEGRDYSGTICNPAGDLIASGSTDLPAHLGTIPFTVKGTLRWLADGRNDADPREMFEPGDIVMMNDPYIGGTHNNDVRLVMPAFFGDELVAFVQDSAHWSDIGGHVPGTFDPNARSSHGEGLVITPLKLVRHGVLDRDLVRFVLRNVRTPEVAYGDLMAQIGAVRLGTTRIAELMSAYGADLVKAEMRSLIEYSERLLRDEFRKLTDGTYSFSSRIDRDPGADCDDPVTVHLDLTIEDERATYDFSQSSSQARGAINATLAVTASAAVLYTKGVFPWIPMNQGMFNAIELVAPSGTICNAHYPAPVSGAAASVYPAVADCVFGCYMQLVPERSMAGMTGLVNTVSGGFDPRPGCEREFVAYIWLEGGWGGRPGKRDNHTAMNMFASSANNVPIEQMERLFPIRFDCYRLEPDSFGAGYHRGGPGVTKAWRFTHGPAVFSSLGDGGRFGPWGYARGTDAPPNSIVYSPDTAEERELGMFATGEHIEQGRLVRFFNSGGGGWGDPKTRPPEWVLEDVVDELLSPAAARRDYGVIVRPSSAPPGWEIDAEATAELRRSER
jgi:N-methylhydantoinase B